MYIGAYNACLGDKSLTEALDILAGLGLNSVEINSGGFLPRSTCPSRTCAPASRLDRTTSVSSPRGG